MATAMKSLKHEIDIFCYMFCQNLGNSQMDLQGDKTLANTQ